MLNTYKIDETKAAIAEWKKQGLTIGLVPTMGYLHAGHLSLIERAVKETDRVVVSIFVNPIQFGPNEDYDSYPRDEARDTELCKNAGASLVFLPTPDIMYTQPHCTHVTMDSLGDGLCGAERPGHFTGVCTVVSKLFNIVKPDKAFFGQKDAQQLAIIKKMVIDLNFDVEVIGCPIVRESDGVAMSSRNTYLSPDERQAAQILNKSLQLGKQSIQNGNRDARDVVRIISDSIKSEPLASIKYVEVVDAVSLKPVQVIKAPVLVAIAVMIGKTRLIDNFSFGEV